MTKLEEAMKFTLDCHIGQKRKRSCLPYAAHPFEVAKVVSDWGISNEDILVSAYLHDGYEDGGTTLEKISKSFGNRVATIVDELTCVDPTKKAEYLGGFATSSVESLVIKIADRLCNVMDFWRGEPDYCVAYFKKANSLFDSFFGRKEEIKQIFGKNVWRNMKRSYYDVVSKIYGEDLQ